MFVGNISVPTRVDHRRTGILATMRKIAHAVNPVVVPGTSDLSRAQPITFATMRIAKRLADQAQAPAVRLYAAHFADDKALVPPDFIHTALLERSSLDVGQFEIPLKLPLITDILNGLYSAATDADYLIYTNVDIGLLPHFYVTVNRLIDEGFDAFSINRRTIPGHYAEVAEIPLMWAETGKPHLGWDCFVFRREAFPAMHLGDACLGAVNIGRLLLVNLALTARNFAEFTDLHLTFHIGNEGGWRQMPMNDYREHNFSVLKDALHFHKANGRSSEHPLFRRIVAKLKEKGHLAQDY